MNFPIPVNMTVDSGEAIQMTVQGDVTVSCVVDLRISPNVQETYDGPYSVTPSESVQTLETDEKLMEDNVTVGAIPDDYIGSSVPRKTSADLTASGPTVTAPAGYYSEAASKSVQSGSVSVPDTEKQVTPTVTVSPVTGTITATVDTSFVIAPTVNEGYVTSGAQGTVRLLGVEVKDLSTQRAKTVTPTESEQTAVASHKYTIGDVKVAAIPSDYIGSEVPQKSSTDLTASGATVTAPAGYYAEAASKSVPSGSASTPNTSIPVHMDVSLSENGLITATVNGSQSVTPNVVEGYVDRGTAGTVSVYSLKKVQLSTQAAKTVTPTETEQTAVAAQKYTTGEVKVGAIPSDYIGSEVPQKSSSDLTVSGATVTAPAGYYSTDAQKTIPEATYNNNITIGIEPYINVTTSGLIGVSKDEVSTLHPVTSGGYAATTDTLPVGVWAHNSLQLDTQAGTTITPTEQEQTAVAAQKYTTGEVKVGAIPSNYVGSSVPTQAAQTITPTTANQTIASGKYLTGAQTILGDANLVPESIVENITIFGVTGNAPPPVTVVHLI